MKTLKEWLCKVFGHNAICIFRRDWANNGGRQSTSTSWLCLRCKHTWNEQYDE